MRTWLRIEFLIQQLSQHLPVSDHATALHFFRNVGDLLDVIERGDVRTELLKDWSASSVNYRLGRSAGRGSEPH